MCGLCQGWLDATAGLSLLNARWSASEVGHSACCRKPPDQRGRQPDAAGALWEVPTLYKRLTISLILMGLAVFSLTAGASAWFSDSGSAGIEIDAGNADLTFDADIDCDGTYELSGVEFDGSEGPLKWWDIAPGDSTADCFVVYNNGTVDLDLYVKHSGVSGVLKNSITFKHAGTQSCGPDIAAAAAFTSDNSGRGCFVGSVAAGGSQALRTDVSFPDNGGNQNSLQNGELNMVATITGYSS